MVGSNRGKAAAFKGHNLNLGCRRGKNAQQTVKIFTIREWTLAHAAVRVKDDWCLRGMDALSLSRLNLLDVYSILLLEMEISVTIRARLDQ